MEDAAERGGADRRPRKAPRALEDWRIVVKDRCPACIDWRTFEQNQDILADNRAEGMAKKTRGTPREGDPLLPGVACCARCGHRMLVRHKGGGQCVLPPPARPSRGLPACQTVRASTIDAAVGQPFLAAVAPAELDALGRAHRMRRKAEDAALAAVRQQVERKRYQAALAQRQYDKVDPDLRLVAAELERRWEVALTDLREAEATLARPEAVTVAPAGPDPELRSKVVSLAGRLPALWSDPATGDDRRKALLRCLVEKVVLERGTHDTAQLRVVWRGGAVSERSVLRPVTGVASLTRGAEMRERILELAHAEIPEDEVAATLTREGHRSPTCAPTASCPSPCRASASRPA